MIFSAKIVYSEKPVPRALVVCLMGVILSLSKDGVEAFAPWFDRLTMTSLLSILGLH
jgi:hypothetical protein